MNKKEPITPTDRIEGEFLPFVRRPSRYIGGEINQIKKDLHNCDLKVALCFPDTYEVGMSYTGLAIIYDILNKMRGVAAERVFTPWLDAEEILRQKGIPLFSLESRAALGSFDVIGFSLTNELCYTNVLNMLDLAGLAVRSEKRTENDPLVIAGGGMANCCEPMAEFIDLLILGEAENAVVGLANLIINMKKESAFKKDILLAAAKKFDWAYVPSLYKFDYESDKIKSFTPLESGLPTRLRNAAVDDLDNAPVPTRPIVPFAEAVQERISIEIMRGCPGRCRFCQASFCRRPIRYRSIDKIIDMAKSCYESTGFETVSLLSLSTADYPDIETLIDRLQNYFADKYVGLSLPSLRVDKHLQLLPKLVSSVRKSGLTFAVEAATENLRQIINKPIKDEDLFAAVLEAYKAGWQKLKLYFMTGLPGETEDDVKQIVHLANKLARLRKEIDGKTASVNITVSWLVPKPHTPFGWLAQKPGEYFEKAKWLILDEKKKLGAKFLQFKFHGIEQSLLESAIGRGGRRLADVIEDAWRNGAKFDLWRESFKPQIWEDAFGKFGMNLDTAAQKHFSTDEILPWEHLGGPEKDYLLKHFAEAMSHRDFTLFARRRGAAE
ncbi:MAG: TIGR03960 family B12-binding radical SAM protein [Sedimentisphaerales bacterium]|nr:TIGR03960 family B12-binding radical SAM protein [Sedimentisphaerales bacterium]